MITVHTDRHRLHHPSGELSGGALIPPVESPARVEHILARVRETGLGAIVEPDATALEAAGRIHDPDYLSFLEQAWEAWQREGFTGEAIPGSWPARGMSGRRPERIEGRLGHYALAADTAIMSGTWAAARAAAEVALTAQSRIADGAAAAFALCRPPGHHAARDLYGGYCFLNNAAIAAQALLDRGAARITVLDIDFHHGNGTQSIFYDREEVQFVSLHGDPRHAFPFYLGYADEIGAGPGEGFNHNFPLPPGADYDLWSRALAEARNRVRAFAPDVLVISLGVDTFARDPISFFRLASEDYLRVGAAIADLKRPTLFVMEGGYAVEEIGINTVNVLRGFEEG
jgi:acetoin utilization deacetylase AcuC-like enzyme